ncbi:MAG: rhodanese-like domain-containing protein [Fimbriimonadaceae bacterium]|nr:rhodanese-like domain-containing protein [Fimbriimonadaceae bacterium]
MIVETVASPGLAQLSYFVADAESGLAAVIDPRRDINIYRELADRHGVRIVYSIETHVHADFVSGSRELAAAFGAEVIGGPTDAYQFPVRTVRSGDAIALGNVRLEALETPGHTPEHIAMLLRPTPESAPTAMCSGDFLFADEVGRPDLLGTESAEPLARQLYRSIHEVIAPLPDDLEILPGHGAGSPCGSQIGTRPTTTLGHERRNNPKLAPMPEAAFVAMVLGDLPLAPSYYPRMKRINAEGPPLLAGLSTPVPVTPAEVLYRQSFGTLVLDTRELEPFAEGHVPGALSIADRSDFPIWAGWMIDPLADVVLVTEDSTRTDAVVRALQSVGLDRTVGVLAGDMDAWRAAGLSTGRLRRVATMSESCQRLDVRSARESAALPVPGAQHVYVPHVGTAETSMNASTPICVICGSGYRATIAASRLLQLGFRDVAVLAGGLNAAETSDCPRSQP